MRKLILATAAVVPLIGVSAAIAEPSCNVAKAEWQPEQALRDKLAAQKWTVKKIKVDNGCYEVYGTDDKGKKVEVYFNPKSLDALPEQEG